MNEPLKLKLFSVYGQLLNTKILKDAWKKVKANRGSGGIDGETIKEFEKEEDKHIEEILQSLKDRSYKPSAVRRVYIPKKNGKLRPPGVPTIRDRIVQQALVMRLEPFFEEKVFHDSSCDSDRTGGEIHCFDLCCTSTQLVSKLNLQEAISLDVSLHQASSCRHILAR